MSSKSVINSTQEWPTWLTLFGCYIAWFGLLYWHSHLSWLWIPLVILLVVLHSSLQHEALHGHPTKNKRFNEWLVLLAPGLFIPYRRFRDLHLKHHRNEKLTDPYDDPESWYLAESDFRSRSRFVQLALTVNSTLVGRMLLGPALSLYAFYSDELKAIVQGNRSIQKAWFMHVLGVMPVAAYLWAVNINIVYYAVVVAYPALSVLMIRTFIEHKACEEVQHRSAIVEAGGLMSFLFLNNNLHAVHHQNPSVSWFTLPVLWREKKEKVLADNNHNYFPGGYLSIAKQWAFKAREPIVHPILRREK